MKVERARIEDLSAIVALERVTAGAPHWAEREYLRAIEDLGGPRRCLLVVRDEQGLAGFAVGSVTAEVAELESVAVRAATRRCGVGGMLCEAVVSWAWAEGAEAVELEVRAESVAAQTLYAELGFQMSGRRPVYYSEPREDAVLMRLERGG